MTVTLRPYQSNLMNGVYNSWAQGNRNVLAVLPTGGGKSVIISEIALNNYRQRKNQAIIAHRNELVSQLSGHMANRGIPHRIIASAKTVSQVTSDHRREYGKSFVNPDSSCSVISVDTLLARKDSLTQWFPQVGMWITDECFPAGTLITTPNGQVPIESISVGDSVTAWDENDGRFKTKKVMRLFKNPKPSVMVDISINGHHTYTTLGHPFWTDRGWVEAGKLTQDDKIYVKLQPMWSVFHDREWRSNLSLEKNRKDFLLQKMRSLTSGREPQTYICEKNQNPSYKNMSSLRFGASKVTCENLFQTLPIKNFIGYYISNKQNLCLRSYEEKKSYVQPSDKAETFRNAETYGSQTYNTGWQWKTFTGCGTKTDRYVSAFGFHGTICFSDGGQKRFRYSPWLQVGHGSPYSQNKYRGGWWLTQRCEEALRCETGSNFEMCRLDGIEIFQSTDNDRVRSDHVYNIEVDECHTYIADDIVVHNCHHLLKDNKWGKAVALLPNAYGLGVTASPCRADGMGLGSHADGVMDDIILGPTMRELIDAGQLCDYEIVCPESDLIVSDDDFSDSGDLSPKKGREASKKSHIVGDVVKEYMRHALFKRAICFATDVETAGEIAENFRANGISAVAISANTDAGVRADYIRKFREGKIYVLVNVDLFGEGFDCLDLQTEILTPNGWKNCIDAMFEEKCYAWNSEQDCIEIVDIEKWGVRNTKPNERMWSVKSQHADIRVSEGHKIFYKKMNHTKTGGMDEKIQVKTAREIHENKKAFAIPLSAEMSFSGVKLTDDEIRILGWYLTDGWLESENKCLCIAQSKEVGVEKIKEILERLGWSYKTRIRQPTKHNYENSKPCMIFSIAIGGKKIKNNWRHISEYFIKDIHPDLHNMTKRQFMILWSSLLDGDGTRQNGKSGTLTCARKTQCDAYMQMAILRGLTPMHGVYYTKKGVKIYNLRVRDNNWLRMKPSDDRGAKFTLECNQTEPVWCVSNRLKTLITRRNGKVAILGNCPGVEAVIMARPTGSLAVYLQQFGRALRLLPGKLYGLIIDHVSNWKRHGFPDKHHYWTLDRREKRAKSKIDPEDIPLTSCKSCSRPYERFLRACPHCGAEPPLPDATGRTVQQVDGDLMLLDRTVLAQMRQAIQLESPADMAARVAMAAGEIAGRGAANRQVERIQAQQRLNDAIAMWAGIGVTKGRSDSEMQRRFFIATGVDTLTALSLPRADMEKLTATVEGWINV